MPATGPGTIFTDVDGIMGLSSAIDGNLNEAGTALVKLGSTFESLAVSYMGRGGTSAQQAGHQTRQFGEAIVARCHENNAAFKTTANVQQAADEDQQSAWSGIAAL